MKSFFIIICYIIVGSCTNISDFEKSQMSSHDFILKNNDNKMDLPEIVSVIDRSANENLDWLNDTENWIKNNEVDYINYRYFLYTTEPIVNKSLCLDLAKSNARSMILETIQKGHGVINGAQLLKSYWKVVRLKRTTATICSVLMKISVKNMLNVH
jgi:hypothetical protein